MCVRTQCLAHIGRCLWVIMVGWLSHHSRAIPRGTCCLQSSGEDTLRWCCMSQVPAETKPSQNLPGKTSTLAGPICPETCLTPLEARGTNISDDQTSFLRRDTWTTPVKTIKCGTSPAKNHETNMGENNKRQSLAPSGQLCMCYHNVHQRNDMQTSTCEPSMKSP